MSIDAEMVNTIDDEVIDALNDACGPIDKDINLEESTNTHGNFENLFHEANRELYPGCKKFSALTFLVKLMHVKVLNCWSDKSFDMLLQLLIDVFPEGSIIPKTYYDAKKMLRELGLGYNSIHACKYDCVLFWRRMKLLINVQCVMSLDISYVMAKEKKFLKKCCVIFLLNQGYKDCLCQDIHQ